MIDKKKLREDYKSLINPMGIFAFTNKMNGKVFLASSLNLKNKDVRLKMSLNNNLYPNKEFQDDWNKDGESNFTYDVLETLEINDDPNYNYKEDLEILESIWIDKFQPLSENTYNKKETIRIV